MAVDSSKLPASPPRDRTGWIIAALLAVIVLPMGVALLLTQLESSPASARAQPVPRWFTAEPIRATTRDGVGVRAKVSVDLSSGSAQSRLERERSQVALLLQISVGSMSRDEISGADGMRRLGDDMRTRLNGLLDGDDAGAVRGVAIQELVLTKI